tara:strand:+ start:2218 stop:2484 length:267 start_codon:yes stop_codon:yes gene_type:complete
MTYHVHAVEQDLANKWYARVCITEEEAVFLKFQDYPTMDEIQDAAVAYVAAQPTEPTGLIRALDADGQFIADDPSTPDVDEAWINAPA